MLYIYMGINSMGIFAKFDLHFSGVRGLPEADQ